MIIEHTDALRNFVLPLLIGLNGFQQRHALNVLEAVLASDQRHKTLAALTRLLLLAHADQFALADFLRVSPWNAEQLRSRMTGAVLLAAGALQKRLGTDKIVLAVDDSLCVKDFGTRKLPAVGLFYDHVEQRRQTRNHSNASRYICLMLVLGPFSFPLSWRLYLKRRQVRKLRRNGNSDIVFLTTHQLVEQMLKEVDTHLPAGQVYVLFDSWYASQGMFKAVRKRGWHFICASRSNRLLSGVPLNQLWRKLAQQRTRRITLRSTKGKRTYRARITRGRVRGCVHDVAVVITKRHRRDLTPAYFMSSDSALSATAILKCYSLRWNCELGNWWLKQRLGLADYRMRSLQGCMRWHALIFVAYAFLCVRHAATYQPGKPIEPFASVLTEHRLQHHQALVLHIAKLARAGYTDAQVLRAVTPT
jgi:hypothetical protein